VMSTETGNEVRENGLRPPIEVLGVPKRGWSRFSHVSSSAVVALEFGLIFVIWEIAVGVFDLVNPIFLPAPSSVADGLFDLVISGEILPHLWSSLVAWTVGFGLAVTLGVATGIIIGVSLPLHRLVTPVLWSFYAIPWLAYRPLTVAWFGFGLPPIIFLVFIASLFPVLFNTAAGVAATDTSLLQAGRIFGSSRFGTYRKIMLPSSLPFIFAGMRQSVVLATLALLVAEMLGATVGVGAMITISTNTYRTEQAFAMIVVAIAWTTSVSYVVGLIGKVVAPWQSDVRRQ
jgi:ABC-type nitrate/sulfonate/bicarbonate transport system permease component